MGWVILFIIIAVISGYIGYVQEYRDPFGAMAGFFTGVFIFVFIGASINSLVETREELVGSTPITAIRDRGTIEGTFFLGSGNIDEEMHYFYMAKTKYGYQMKKIKAADIYLMEDSAAEPRIEFYSKEFTFDILEWILPSWRSGRTVIYIPEGSIKHNFAVDLE